MRSVARWTPVAAVFLAITISSEVEAKACTTTQLTQLTGVAATYSSSPDCAGSALDTSTNTVAVICAGACMELVRQLEPDTPDCEYEGTNLGETMGRLVAWCDAASTTGSASSSASSLSSSGSTDINTTETVPICTTENVILISDINTEVAKNADCLGSAGAATGATNKTAYCAEDACVAYMTDVEARLPNCTYGGNNIKQVVADTLALCDDSTVVWPNATTPTATEATTTTLAPTTASSADSQTTDSPGASKSAASALKPSASYVTTLILTIALFRNQLVTSSDWTVSENLQASNAFEPFLTNCVVTQEHFLLSCVATCNVQAASP